MIVEIGRYLLNIDENTTKKSYENQIVKKFDREVYEIVQNLLSNAPKETLDFLSGLGIDVKKLCYAHPVSVYEDGFAAFHFTCRLVGKIVCGSTEPPRIAEEAFGMSLVFVDDSSSFSPVLTDFPEPQIELRFVMTLPYENR